MFVQKGTRWQLKFNPSPPSTNLHALHKPVLLFVSIFCVRPISSLRLCVLPLIRFINAIVDIFVGTLRVPDLEVRCFRCEYVLVECHLDLAYSELNHRFFRAFCEIKFGLCALLLICFINGIPAGASG